MLIRLTGLLDADAEARELPRVDVEQGDDLDVRDLTVRLPDDQVLVDDLDLHLTRGRQPVRDGPVGQRQDHAAAQPRRPVALRGRDGAAAARRRRAVPVPAALRPAGHPAHRAGLPRARPATSTTPGPRPCCARCSCPHLVDRLDEETDWARRLSPGEQQRLGFARVLLVRPRVAFLDEATSALDEGMEHTLYTLLREELPDTVIVSVGHRSTLNRFHAERLELLGEGRWQVAALSH